MLYKIRYKNKGETCLKEHYMYYNAENVSVASEMFKAGYEHKHQASVDAELDEILVAEFGPETGNTWIDPSVSKETTTNL